MKVKIINWIKIVYLVTVILSLGGVILISVFLYQNFYLTIKKIDNIYKLQNQTFIETVNVTLFNKVEERNKQKVSKPLPDFGFIENPFR